MSNIPADLKYLKSHEWVRKLDDGSCVIGITDHAQDTLGDLVYVELPAAGTKLEAEDACGVLESVKAASDVFAPMSGEVMESNEALADKPELLNEDPYGDAWLWKMRPDDAAAVDALLDAAGYEAVIADEG